MNMEEVREVLDKIKNIYFSNLDNDNKYNEVVKLWNEFYKLCNKKNIYLEEVEDLRMLFEHECYSIYQEPKYEILDNDKVNNAFLHLKDVIYKNRGGLVDGLSMEEVNDILDYVVFKVREIYSNLGVDIKVNSLNGYCELGQSLSIRLFDELGLKVTKNNAKDLMNYEINHCFGTVTFPIIDNGVVSEKNFLIDTTYRQFFTSIRCNDGMYLNKSNEINRPDPGYFIKDVEFAKKLMKDGYVLLDEDSAKAYGEPFYLSSLSKEDIPINRNIDYLNSILDSYEDYKLNIEELEGLEVKIPDSSYRRGRM